MENIQLSRKLDYKKINLFVIKMRKSNINYKLKLLNWIKIYPVFHVSLLESADSETQIIVQKSSELLHYNKHKIKKIKEYNSETQ